MIQAATLSYDDVADKMRAIVARDAAPPACWIITVPETNRGVAWQLALAGLWANATFNAESRLRVLFSELAKMEGRRVIVLIGVRRA
ncbi:hypothetical protein [Thauera sp.]|uniref:hypothetical protein n=1 Tax=Thauera sp. TaxID=1905334 RepID=UPI002C571EA4|nr:hypothetical protein [Thauera sp.]HRP26361.1 hypothetical protein [Thauera sp.]